MKKKSLLSLPLIVCLLSSCSLIEMSSSQRTWSYIKVSSTTSISSQSSTHKHNYKKTIFDPTCLDDGYTLYTCEECGSSYKDDVIEALGHKFGEWNLYLDGYSHEGYVRQCERCHKYQYDLTPSEHTFGGLTFYDDTYHEHQCSGCNYVEKQIHDYTIVSSNSSYKIVKCESCSTQKTITIPSIDDISSYSLLCAKKLREESSRLFLEAISNNEVASVLLPYSDLSTYKEIKDFTLDLVKDVETDLEKVTIIYNWIRQNITYYEDAKNANVYEVFNIRKAIDTGYVILMHDMLSSIGIMSMYANGYASLPEDSSSIFTIDTNKERHAWLSMYVNGTVYMCDPCLGRNDGDTYFNMSDNFISSSFLTLSLQMVNIIPDGYNYLAYSNDTYRGVYRTSSNDVVHYTSTGFYKNGSLYRFSHNGYGEEYMFSYGLDDMKYDGINIYGTAFNNGILYKKENANVPSSWYYASKSSVCHTYTDMIMFTMFEKTFYNTNYYLARSNQFSVSDNTLYYNYGNGYRLIMGEYNFS